MSHSERNTSLAFFTSYERSLLKSTWGSRATHLSRDSFLPFGACQLCLLPSRDPVACPRGDVFCRECAVANLLAQTKEIKRLERDMQRATAEREHEEARREDEARERAVREFDMLQMGLEARGPGRVNGVVEEEAKASAAARPTEAKSKKRKFELDLHDLVRIARDERAKARRAIDRESAAAAKKHLPSFWIPSETPTEANKADKQTKLHPLCPASDEAKPHRYALKTLVAVNFTEEKVGAAADAAVRSCPACKKALTNATKAMLAVPCGHVVCKPCAGKFMQPHETADAHHLDAEFGVVRCYVCEARLGDGLETKTAKQNGDRRESKDRDGVKPGLVEIRCEGTGFAAGGKNMTKKEEGVAFQC